MSILSVLMPVFVQVALCFVLLFGLVASRAMAGSEVPGADPSRKTLRDIRLARASRFGASYGNQFELPVLFFALVPLALITHKADAVFVVLEWLFVTARLAQAVVHVTINLVPLRGLCFLACGVALGLAWIKLALDLLAAG